MQNTYDIIYLTNTPSFYKVNLCNEIGDNCRLLLVLYGYGDEAVNSVIDDAENLKFDFVFLSQGNAAKRSKIKTFYQLCHLLYHLKYRYVLYAGWFVPEYNLMSFFTPRQKNVVLCESSMHDTHFTGLRGLIKRMIISRMLTALPSGVLHKQVFEQIKFTGKICMTGGVGIFNKGDRHFLKKFPHAPLRYLYVGRLVSVKNIGFLIRQFNKLGKPLTIIGTGEQEEYLKNIACDNITFEGFISNEMLPQVYDAHDVFILPSVYEPWGLVVDEAIYWGLPVIVSNVVGCSVDMVEQLGTGVVFESNNSNSFIEAITEIERNYTKYKCCVDAVDFEKRDEKQVEAYLQLLR